MDNTESSVLTWRSERMPKTIADRTRRVYDRVALVYPLSTFFFHADAHRCALEVSGIRDGMRVLEIATGSGEMFRRIVGANRTGETIGVDLSPNMAVRTHQRIRRKYPSAAAHCQAVDARYMPFRDESFDAVFCCYLLELLGSDDIVLTLREIRRVLRHNGTLTLVCIGQNTTFFNRLYRVAGGIAPAFWGRQVEQRVPSLIEGSQFHILEDRGVKQSGYPSRVFVASKNGR